MSTTTTTHTSQKSQHGALRTPIQSTHAQTSATVYRTPAAYFNDAEDGYSAAGPSSSRTMPGTPRFAGRQPQSSSSGPRSTTATSTGAMSSSAAGPVSAAYRTPASKTFKRPAPKSTTVSVRSNASSAKRRACTSSATRSATTKSISSSSSNRNPIIIMAVVEGRGHAKGDVGIASMSLTHPELRLSQFADGSSYAKLRTKIDVLRPIEIIMPDVAIERNGSMVAMERVLLEHFPHIKITAVPRKTFNELEGLDMFRRLNLTDPDSSVDEKDLQNRYYCLAAASALVTHVETIQNVQFMPHSVKVSYVGIEKTCMIDPNTARQLELVAPARPDATKQDKQATLLSVLNHTCTTGGLRMLRAGLLQPSCDPALIEARLDALGDLLESDDKMFNLASVVGRMVDIENIIGSCVQVARCATNIYRAKQADVLLGQVVQLKHTLDLVKYLRDCLADFTAETWRTAHQIRTRRSWGADAESGPRLALKVFVTPVWR